MRAIFKCRLCGEKYTGCICGKNGSIGLSDFLGFENDEVEK